MNHYRGCGHMFLVLCTVFITTVTGTFDQNMQPVGPELCKHHCAQIYECTFCVFLIKRFTCIASFTKTPPRTNGEEAVSLDITKEKIRTFPQRKELCTERPSRMILSRSKDFQCIRLKVEEQTRVLVSPLMTGGSRFPLRVIHLEDNSITSYRHIRPQFVTAMAYVQTLRHVLIATMEPATIQAFSLHTTYGVTLKRGVYARSIAVDDAKRLVFLATETPFDGLASMTPDGRNFRNITSRIQPLALCLDIERYVLYVADYVSVSSHSYSGQRLQTIARSRDTHGITLGDQGNVMYYNDKKNIVRLELFKKEKRRKVIKSNINSRNILYRNGYLCVSHMYKWKISVLHESNYSNVRQVNIKSLSRQVIALIP